MKRHQEALGQIVMADPDVATIAMNIGGSGRAGNNGNLFITLKPRNQRSASAQQIIARLRPQLDKVEGARLYMQAAQDVRLGGRPTRTQFEFTLQDARNTLRTLQHERELAERIEKGIKQLRATGKSDEQRSA